MRAVGKTAERSQHETAAREMSADLESDLGQACADNTSHVSLSRRRWYGARPEDATLPGRVDAVTVCPFLGLQQRTLDAVYGKPKRGNIV